MNLRAQPMRWAMALAAGLWLAAVATGPAAAQKAISGLMPANPQPADDALEPGLAVEYLSILARHVDEVERAGKGHPGPTLEMLDWNTLDGEVLTSGQTDGVGARISGFIRFDAPGTYLMATQSNDGVRVKISDRVIIDDPDVHPDKFSENVALQITEPGWYPLYIVYFERRNTATLELYWQPPGTDGFDFVPAEAFAHQKP